VPLESNSVVHLKLNGTMIENVEEHTLEELPIPGVGGGGIEG